MAFMTREIIDLKGILLLMLMFIAPIASTNIDCNGKAFRCVNSTHFMICVDLGTGISTTIDDFVMHCPLTTECRPTNRYECEFAAPIIVTEAPTTIITTVTAAESIVTTEAAISTQVDVTTEVIDQNVATFNPDVAVSVPFEEYFNTLSTTTLSELEMSSHKETKTNASILDNVITSTNTILPETITESTTSNVDSGYVDINLSVIPFDSTTNANNNELITTTGTSLIDINDTLVLSGTSRSIRNESSDNNIMFMTTEQTVTEDDDLKVIPYNATKANHIKELASATGTSGTDITDVPIISGSTDKIRNDSSNNILVTTTEQIIMEENNLNVIQYNRTNANNTKLSATVDLSGTDITDMPILSGSTVNITNEASDNMLVTTEQIITEENNLNAIPYNSSNENNRELATTVGLSGTDMPIILSGSTVNITNESNDNILVTTTEQNSLYAISYTSTNENNNEMATTVGISGIDITDMPILSGSTDNIRNESSDNFLVTTTEQIITNENNLDAIPYNDTTVNSKILATTVSIFGKDITDMPVFGESTDNITNESSTDNISVTNEEIVTETFPTYLDNVTVPSDSSINKINNATLESATIISTEAQLNLIDDTTNTVSNYSTISETKNQNEYDHTTANNTKDKIDTTESSILNTNNNTWVGETSANVITEVTIATNDTRMKNTESSEKVFTTDNTFDTTESAHTETVIVTNSTTADAGTTLETTFTNSSKPNDSDTSYTLNYENTSNDDSTTIRDLIITNAKLESHITESLYSYTADSSTPVVTSSYMEINSVTETILSEESSTKHQTVSDFSTSLNQKISESNIINNTQKPLQTTATSDIHSTNTISTFKLSEMTTFIVTDSSRYDVSINNIVDNQTTEPSISNTNSDAEVTEGLFMTEEHIFSNYVTTEVASMIDTKTKPVPDFAIIIDYVDDIQKNNTSTSIKDFKLTTESDVDYENKDVEKFNDNRNTTNSPVLNEQVLSTDYLDYKDETQAHINSPSSTTETFLTATEAVGNESSTKTSVTTNIIPSTILSGDEILSTRDFDTVDSSVHNSIALIGTTKLDVNFITETSTNSIQSNNIDMQSNTDSSIYNDSNKGSSSTLSVDSATGNSNANILEEHPTTAASLIGTTDTLTSLSSTNANKQNTTYDYDTEQNSLPGMSSPLDSNILITMNDLSINNETFRTVTSKLPEPVTNSLAQNVNIDRERITQSSFNVDVVDQSSTLQPDTDLNKVSTDETLQNVEESFTKSDIRTTPMSSINKNVDIRNSGLGGATTTDIEYETTIAQTTMNMATEVESLYTTASLPVIQLSTDNFENPTISYNNGSVKSLNERRIVEITNSAVEDTQTTISEVQNGITKPIINQMSTVNDNNFRETTETIITTEQMDANNLKPLESIQSNISIIDIINGNQTQSVSNINEAMDTTSTSSYYANGEVVLKTTNFGNDLKHDLAGTFSTSTASSFVIESVTNSITNSTFTIDIDADTYLQNKKQSTIQTVDIVSQDSKTEEPSVSNPIFELKETITTESNNNFDLSTLETIYKEGLSSDIQDVTATSTLQNQRTSQTLVNSNPHPKSTNGSSVTMEITLPIDVDTPLKTSTQISGLIVDQVSLGPSKSSNSKQTTQTLSELENVKVEENNKETTITDFNTHLIKKNMGDTTEATLTEERISEIVVRTTTAVLPTVTQAAIKNVQDARIEDALSGDHTILHLGVTGSTTSQTNINSIKDVTHNVHSSTEIISTVKEATDIITGADIIIDKLPDKSTHSGITSELNLNSQKKREDTESNGMQSEIEGNDSARTLIDKTEVSKLKNTKEELLPQNNGRNTQHTSNDQIETVPTHKLKDGQAVDNHSSNTKSKIDKTENEKHNNIKQEQLTQNNGLRSPHNSNDQIETAPTHVVTENSQTIDSHSSNSKSEESNQSKNDGLRSPHTSTDQIETAPTHVLTENSQAIDSHSSNSKSEESNQSKNDGLRSPHTSTDQIETAPTHVLTENSQAIDSHSSNSKSEESNQSKNDGLRSSHTSNDQIETAPTHVLTENSQAIDSHSSNSKSEESNQSKNDGLRSSHTSNDQIETAPTHVLTENSQTIDSHSSSSKSEESNQSDLHVQSTDNISSTTVRYTPRPKNTKNTRDRHTEDVLGIQSTPPKQIKSNYDCKQKRGRYADEQDCRKFFICLGNGHVITGTCPVNTVFSEIRKQCTNNLSHCIRNNQFQCLTEGRFSDYLDDNVYYVCVRKNVSSVIRFKFQCLNGYHLNKSSVRCVLNTDSSQSDSKSDSTSTTNVRESTPSRDVEKKEENESSENKFRCKKEGKFPDSSNPRRYFECKRDNDGYRQKRKKCRNHKFYNKEKKTCVDEDSDVSNESG